MSSVPDTSYSAEDLCTFDEFFFSEPTKKTIIVHIVYTNMCIISYLLYLYGTLMEP